MDLKGAREVTLLTDFARGSYAAVGRLYRLTLEMAGVAVTERPIPLSSEERERTAQELSGAAVLFNTIGPNFAPLENSFNIAVPFHEWSMYPRAWVESLNGFDEVWAPSDHVFDVLKRSGVTAPAMKLPPALDIDPIPVKTSWKPSGPFRFLSIGEPHFRKGFHLLMEGFMKAFPSADEAELVIKTSPQCDWDPPRGDIRIMRETLSLERVLSLYSECDAYVTASLGEGLGLPVAEAVIACLPVVANFWGGHRSLLAEGGFWEIAHAQTHQPFCSRPSYYAPGQMCAFSSPEQIARTLRLVKDSSAGERETRAARAKDHLLACYGKEAALARIRRRFGFSA